MQDTQTMLSPGTRVRDRYLIKSLVGRGNSGAVYLVEDQRAKPGEQRVFALKEITGLSKQERVQFVFNSVSLRKINHQAIPRIHHIFNDDKRSRLGIVMDYIDGPDLETLYQHKPGQRFSWHEVKQIMAPIVDAVSYLHRQETPIVHGDIKPINILMVQSGERFILVDIGISKETDSGSDSQDELSGYKAPEQYGQNIDGRADIYGLGATCYTLLTGVIPPNALARAAHIASEQEDPLKPVEQLVVSIPSHVARAIHRSLSIHASERLSSVEEFWQALQSPPQEARPTVNDGILPATATTPVATRQKWGSAAIGVLSRPEQLIKKIAPIALLRRNFAVLLALLLLVGAGAGIWSLAQSHHPSTTGVSNVATPSSALTRTVPGSVTPIMTPTSSPGSYPSIVGSYTGTLADLATKSSATIILQGIHQVGASLNGFFTVGSPLGISGPFSGTIDHSKQFQFLVKDAAGQPIMLVEGAIQTATTLSGNFYRCSPATSGASCIRSSDGYGIWSAQLVNPAG